MDFGLLGLDSFVGSFSLASSGFGGGTVSDPETKQKLYGSGLFKKQERGVHDGGDGGGGDDGYDDEVGSWKSSKKMAKAAAAAAADDFSGSGNNSNKSMSVLGSGSSLFSADSSYQQQNHMLSFSCPKSHSQNAPILPCFQPSSVSPYSRNAGCNGSNSGIYNGFTASQWMELEHQALIYKYLNANMPIPSNLLLPIRKAFESAGLSCLRSNTLGWGGFHLGFSSSTDPEPGRCRRTDGKKWRCSRDAVADQKYCERHMNRGRHRSRKPVEGQQQLHGHSSTVGSSVGGGSASKNAFTLSQPQQLKDSSHSTSINGVFPSKNITRDEKPQGSSSVSRFSSTDASSKSGDLFLVSKYQNPFEESSHNEFGFISSDSLLNPSTNRPSPLLSLSCHTPGASASHHQLLQFMENFPRNNSDKFLLSSSSDFSSSVSRNREATLSPLRLCREPEPLQMGSNNIHQSWESSILGGPLGEALHSSSQSSPTGVLQKASFVSISNSSNGSSPRADSGRVYEGSSFSSDLLRPFPSLVHCSSSLPP